MALFGSAKDFNTMMGINYELIKDVISQAVGYYKISLADTKVNLYGEATNKQYIGPVLLNCLIDRGDFSMDVKEQGLDRTRPVTFRFLRSMYYWHPFLLQPAREQDHFVQSDEHHSNTTYWIPCNDQIRHYLRVYLPIRF